MALQQTHPLPHSIGKFAFNRSDGSYSFDGVNYKNGGEIFCKWKSSMVEINRANREIIYMFKAYIREESYMQNHGFGVVRTEANGNGNPVPGAGHYIETREDDSPYTHSMIPLEKIIEGLGISRGEEDTEHFHSRIVRSYHEKRLDEQQEAVA